MQFHIKLMWNYIIIYRNAFIYKNLFVYVCEYLCYKEYITIATAWFSSNIKV